jgi:neutral ceramidase
MVDGNPVQSTAVPDEFESKLLSFLPPVIVDSAPIGRDLGEVLKQPGVLYSPGQTVEVVFQSANPRNNFRRYQTFLEVQLYNSSVSTWTVVHTDDDWCTKYIWDRPNGPLSSESTATVQWEIPSEVAHGTYRVKHYGDAKSLSGRVTAFEGTSWEFEVDAARRVGR